MIKCSPEKRYYYERFIGFLQAAKGINSNKS